MGDIARIFNNLCKHVDAEPPSLSTVQIVALTRAHLLPRKQLIKARKLDPDEQVPEPLKPYLHKLDDEKTWRYLECLVELCE